MRGEHGQTAAETLGALLVVSVIVAGVATTDVGATIRSEGERIVCEIGGGDCAPQRVKPDNARYLKPLSDDPGAGPPLVLSPPLVTLPYPGSISVTCDYDRRRKTCDLNPEDKNGAKVATTADVKIERSPTTLDANGCPWQSLSVSTTFKASAGVGGKTKDKKVGGALEGYVGNSLTYGATVAPDAADDIAKLRRKPPNPIDPRSIGKGESVQLTEEFYAGAGAQASYRRLQIGMSFETGRRLSSGVTRISPTTVRVLVGDEKFVRAALKLGVDFRFASLGLGNTKDLSSGKLRALDIDISSEAGWKAYQRFVLLGSMPKPGAAGTSNPTSAKTVHYTDVTSWEGKFGPVSFGSQGASSDGQITETTDVYGHTETVQTARYNNTSIAVTTKRDARDVVQGEPTYSLMLHDLDESYLKGLYERTGQRVPAHPSRDVRLDFTQGQLARLQNIALEKLADKIALNRDGRPSLQEIKQSLQDNHGVIKYKGTEYAFGGLESDLGGARDYNEMLIALYRRGFITPNNVIEKLALLLAGKQRALPATIKTPSC